MLIRRIFRSWPSSMPRLAPACAMLALLLALAVPAGAQAQGQPAPTAPSLAQALEGKGGDLSAENLEELANTLRNDAERQKFLDTLDTMIAVRRDQAAKTGAAEEEAALSDRVAKGVAGYVGAFGDRMAKVLGVLRTAPEVASWLEEQVTLEAKRDRLIGLLWRFLAIVGAGMAAQYMFRRGTAAVRRRLEHDYAAESVAARVVRFVGRALMLYLNAFAYGAGAYGAYVFLPMAPPADAVLLVGASSFFAAKLILATARMLLSPGVPSLRIGSMSDETAQYLYIWVRRLVRVFVYAFFFLEAMRVVGLPAPAHQSLLYLTGLALVGFLVVFVMQNRATVAAAIRGGGRAGFGGGVRARLASVWHLAALAYISAVYIVWLFKVKGGFEFLMIATGWSLLILIAAKIVVVGADRGFDRLLRIGAERADRFPGLEARANHYMPVLRGTVHWILYLGAFVVILDVWGLDTLEWLASPAGAAAVRTVVTILVILFIALVIWEMTNVSITRYVHRLDDQGKNSARVRTLLPLMRTTLMIVLIVLVGLIVLSELGVNIAPLLAGAGVLGLAIGFGSQKLVQDVITGLFMLVEDTLAVGDVVKFDGTHAGIVESLSIRTVKLRDLSGNLHTLPFSEVKTTVNMTKDFAFYLMDVGVAYREDVDHVIAVLRDIGEEMQKDETFGKYITDPLEILGLDKFADSAIVIKARLRIQPPIQQWMVGREFNRRMKARFDREGIEIPFPHQTIYFGEDQKGNAPPARVLVSSGDGGRPAPEKDIARDKDRAAGRGADNVEARAQAEAEARDAAEAQEDARDKDRKGD